MSLQRVHTVSSPDPVLWWREIVADCGRPLGPCQVVASWDVQAMGARVEFTPNVCPRCRLASDKNQTAKYIYVVAPRAKQELEEAS